VRKPVIEDYPPRGEGVGSTELEKGGMGDCKEKRLNQGCDRVFAELSRTTASVKESKPDKTRGRGEEEWAERAPIL